MLRNSQQRRFMFDDIPENYRSQTADDEEEGWRYTQGDKNARRPPELLTRDHVSRCIVREIKEGRGSPHGGVYLDISWIKDRLPNAAEHIKKKLPSMYHQFKQLADIDITQRADGSRADDALHHGRRAGRRRDADVERARSVRGGRVRRRHQRREPARRQFAVRPAGVRQARRRIRRAVRATSRRPARSTTGRSEEAARQALEPFDRGTQGEGPYQVQYTLQDMMQDLVGIVRNEPEMRRALDGLAQLRERAAASASAGHREYNPGWHTALDLHNLLTVSEAITRSAIERAGEPRRTLPRRLSRQGRGLRHASTSSFARSATAAWRYPARANPEMPEELKKIIEEMK